MNADFLGLEALHTLWVGAGVAALAFVARGLVPARDPAGRSIVSFGGLVLMAATPFVIATVAPKEAPAP